MQSDHRASSRAALHILTLSLLAAFMTIVAAAHGRNPYRQNFLEAYPSAVSSRLDDLPGLNNHCGVCHFAFGGGGPRNPYGLAVEATDRSPEAILGR